MKGAGVVRASGNMTSRLLRKNTSAARVAAFILSNFIGLAIVMGALQFYGDARSIWEEEDSFISTDYLVVNKKVTSSNTVGAASTAFTEEEIADIRRQPWVRKLGPFTANAYHVTASVRSGERGMSTDMFFEAIPDDFVDVPRQQWIYRPGSGEVPIIISKEYLALYNFGFAASAGLPQMSEGIMSGIPMQLTLTGRDGRRLTLNGRVAGYSNRLNTILVPQQFMDETNSSLAPGLRRPPSRVIIDTNSPGDVAITRYLEEHDLEVAGDKSGSSASFLLKVIVGVVLAIGGIITVLSIFILVLSISLILEKNRMTLHRLMMLGYGPGTVARPYRRLVVLASCGAFLLALGGVWGMRAWYLSSLEGLGGGDGSIWLAPAAGALMMLLSIGFNILTVRRSVRGAWRL